jgi:hypothetical protein
MRIAGQHAFQSTQIEHGSTGEKWLPAHRMPTTRGDDRSAVSHDAREFIPRRGPNEPGRI